MEYTYVCVIIGSIKRKIEPVFIYGGGPSYRQKSMRTERKVT